MTVAFTGHRPSKLGNEYNGVGPVSDFLRKEIIKKVIEIHHPTFIEVGMAIGLDQLAADIAIEFSIPFRANIPFKGQELIWPEISQDRYNRIINHPLCTKYYVHEKTNHVESEEIPEFPFYKAVAYKYFEIAKMMDDRNIWMIEQLINPEDRLVAIHDGTKGGTNNCINAAIKRGKEIIRIDPRNAFK